jgi:uncharacterized membrane protein YfcA
MWRLAIAFVATVVIAALMAMTGRGGGNFYVPVLVACGVPMLEAATAGQCMLLTTAAAASLVFQKRRTIDWKLALVIDPPTDVMAFVGGYYAHLVNGATLKVVFAALLVVAALLMLRPVRERHVGDKKRFGFWRRRYGEYDYVVNLWLTLPITAATGLVAGMVGISGGSFKVPLMVLACGVPMRIAVGTSSAMVAATAFMGMIGHTAAGDFNALWAIPMSIAAVLGGVVGGSLSLRTRPENLKKIFAYTTLGAAVFMALNSWLSIAAK